MKTKRIELQITLLKKALESEIADRKAESAKMLKIIEDLAKAVKGEKEVKE